MLIERKIRSIIEKYPLKDKQMQDVMERWMIYLAEEIVESIEEKQNKLATKEDLKQFIELMNARFEAQQKETNALRQEMSARFEALEKRLGFMQWLIGGGVLLMLLKLFFPHFFPH